MKDEIFELADNSKFDIVTMENQVESLLGQVKEKFNLPEDAKIESFKIDWLKKCRKVCLRIHGRRVCVCV